MDKQKKWTDCMPDTPEKECDVFKFRRLQEILKLTIQQREYININRQVTDLHYKIRKQDPLIDEYEIKLSEAQGIIEKTIYDNAFRDGFWLGLRMAKQCPLNAEIS